MRKIITIFIILGTLQTTSLVAQELRCRVNVQYSEIPNADKDMFNTLRSTIEEAMNSKVWTENTFEEHEKIDMRITIRVTKQNSNKNFSGSIQIQSSRPVYNSTYTTPMFNHVDEKMNFQYEENEPIEFSENSYLSNMSSILAFYAYIVIGIDYDSFSLLGGTPYFQKAQNIVNAAQASGETGWSSKDDSEGKTLGKYWIVENILNSTYVGYRNALYMYHRLGFDIMYEKPAEARKQMIQAFTELEKVSRIKPASLLLTIFFYAKKDELIQIFTEALPDEKALVVTSFKKLNPSNANEYDKILAK